MSRPTAARAVAEIHQAAAAAAACLPDVPAPATDIIRRLRALESWATTVGTPMESREAVTIATQLAQQLHRELSPPR